MNSHDCIQDDNIAEIKKTLVEIKKDLKDIKEIKKAWDFLDTGNKFVFWLSKMLIAVGAIIYAFWSIVNWLRKPPV